MDRLFLVDLDRCFGCHTCEVACKQEKDLPVGPRLIQVLELGPRRVAGRVHRDFVPTLCCQCTEAPCMEICPTGSLIRDSDGVVRLDESQCTGCHLCVIACPYGFMGSHPDSLKVVKCDFCCNLVEKGLDPSCVSHCPANALHLRPKSDLAEFLSCRHCMRIGQLVYVSRIWKLSSPILNPKKGESNVQKDEYH